MKRSRPNQWPIKPDDRAFWDPIFRREYLGYHPGRPEMTRDEFNYLVDRGANARDMMDRMPIGLDPMTVMDILLNEIRESRREIRTLQDDKIDKILLIEDE